MSIAVGWANVGVWNSINWKSFNPTWVGASLGGGLGMGSSVGIVITIQVRPPEAAKAPCPDLRLPPDRFMVH
jgi:hypothetical protein